MEPKEPENGADRAAPMPIPRGVEVLVKKAAVDADFKQILLSKRAGSASEIGLTLEPSEVAMVNAVPEAQLEAIIARTTVHPRQRAAFLGSVAAVMIVALGASVAGCGKQPTKGVGPDRPSKDRYERPDRVEPSEGIDPERPTETESE